MNYDRERAYYEQDCLEEMIRMRTPKISRDRICTCCSASDPNKCSQPQVTAQLTTATEGK